MILESINQATIEEAFRRLKREQDDKGDAERRVTVSVIWEDTEIAKFQFPVEGRTGDIRVAQTLYAIMKKAHEQSSQDGGTQTVMVGCQMRIQETWAMLDLENAEFIPEREERIDSPSWGPEPSAEVILHKEQNYLDVELAAFGDDVLLDPNEHIHMEMVIIPENVTGIPATILSRYEGLVDPYALMQQWKFLSQHAVSQAPAIIDTKDLSKMLRVKVKDMCITGIVSPASEFKESHSVIAKLPTPEDGLNTLLPTRYLQYLSFDDNGSLTTGGSWTNVRWDAILNRLKTATLPVDIQNVFNEFGELVREVKRVRAEMAWDLYYREYSSKLLNKKQTTQCGQDPQEKEAELSTWSRNLKEPEASLMQWGEQHTDELKMMVSMYHDISKVGDHEHAFATLFGLRFSTPKVQKELDSIRASCPIITEMLAISKESPMQKVGGARNLRRKRRRGEYYSPTSPTYSPTFNPIPEELHI